MATHWTLGCDADDPQRIAAFWAGALGYVEEPGFDDPDSASIVDPDGRGPAIGFLKVPEGKRDEPRTDFGFPLWSARGLVVRRRGWP
ncbi:VOC family protein [Actinomycetes bacterium KLBMP 9797]